MVWRCLSARTTVSTERQRCRSTTQSALECGTVHVVQSSPSGVLAATDGGLFHRRGGEWYDASVPRTPVTAVAVAPDGQHCYAGTSPADVYRCPVTDWTTPLEGWRGGDVFATVPDQDRWRDRSPRDRGAQVRTLAVTPAAPRRIFAGVEVGGVLRSDNPGESWTNRSRGVHDDVHHLLVHDDRLIAACGNGLYQTGGDASETAWHRLDTNFREFSSGTTTIVRASSSMDGCTRAPTVGAGRPRRCDRHLRHRAGPAASVSGPGHGVCDCLGGRQRPADRRHAVCARRVRTDYAGAGVCSYRRDVVTARNGSSRGQIARCCVGAPAPQHAAVGT